MSHSLLRRRVASLAASALAALSVVAAAIVTADTEAVAVVGATTIQIDGQSRQVDGENVRRLSNYLVIYSNAGTRTGTNSYGFEAAVVDGRITQVQDGVGNMLVPANGYVLSGHGDDRTWLKARAQVGDTVGVNGQTTGATPVLPDIGIRTLRNFSIVYPTSGQFAGRKLLKFPGVTANVGQGRLEIIGTRSASTTDDWKIAQQVYNTDGTKTQLPFTAAGFVYGGDGHNHWHIRDFDSYELLKGDGSVLERGEKHGFCFEDNTSYRNWPGNPAFPAAPAQPYYTTSNVCGVGDRTLTQVMHGLSVGWSDTYPASLPDQAIDVTGVADGEYIVKVEADWQGFWAETNENNNAATARIRITGNTVALISATDGL